MDIINRIFIKVFAKKVGEDEFGNQYYQKKGKRFVVYKGIVEPTKVPMPWHAWLHFYSDEIPHEVEKHSWQKIHLPNLSGTINAYSPDSATEKTSQNYQAWEPNS